LEGPIRQIVEENAAAYKKAGGAVVAATPDDANCRSAAEVAARRRRSPRHRDSPSPHTNGGGRTSELLALTPGAIDLDSGVTSIETLKRRKRGIVRQVPLPPDLLDQLEQLPGWASMDDTWAGGVGRWWLGWVF
jgi:integrase